MFAGRCRIPLSQVGEGVSTFTLSIGFGDLGNETDSRFPDHILVQVGITPVDDDFLSRLSVSTRICLICDRCGETFSRELRGGVDTVYTQDPVRARNGDADMRWFPPGQDFIDIEDDIRDALFLALPKKSLCRQDCKGLCTRCGANLNETVCVCPNNEADSRWDALKNIKFD